MSLMRLCLGVETVQSIVSVLCQIIFLCSVHDINDPLMSAEAGALFGLNIFFSILTVIISLIMLFFKEFLLKQTKRSSASIELDEMFRGSAGITRVQENPMRDLEEPSARGRTMDLESHTFELQSKIDNLESENQSLRECHSELVEQYEESRAVIKTLQKQLQDRDDVPIPE